MPPAATTSASSPERSTRSATAGTRVIVARRMLPWPPPIKPSPPAALTAPASAPPALPPIGANSTGWRMPRRPVSAVRSAIAGYAAGLLGGEPRRLVAVEAGCGDCLLQPFDLARRQF